MPLRISFSGDPNSPYLEVNASYYSHGHQRTGPKWLGIVRGGDSDLDSKIKDWGRKQIQFEGAWKQIQFEGAWKQIQVEGDGSFGSHVEKFLMAYVDQDGLTQANNLEDKHFDDRQNFVSGQKSCMEKLVSLRCMWRVWCCKQFFFRRASDPVNDAFAPLPARQQAIQDYLHQLAGEAISVYEKAILKEVDKLLNPNSLRKKEHPILYSASKVSTWVTLWQLILIYRHTLGEMIYGQYMNASSVPIGGQSTRNSPGISQRTDPP